MNKPIFMAMVGAPGSGKTAYAAQYAGECNVEVFSSGSYRKKILGDEGDQSANGKIFDELYKDLISALRDGRNCILDATNCTLKDRLRVMNRLSGVPCFKIAAVMSTDPETCIKRDEGREERQVGKEVVLKFVRNFTFPQLWEGWDRVYVQGYDTDLPPRLNERAVGGMLSQMRGFKQKTPHHDYDLLTHSEKLAENYREDPVLYRAALAHDFGKTIPWDWLVKPEEGVRRYPHHAHIGAYYLLQNLEVFEGNSWEDIYESMFYVSYHMDARRWNDSPETREKYEKLVGKERFEKMMEFIRFDELACGNGDHKYHAEISKKIKEGYYLAHPEEVGMDEENKVEEGTDGCGDDSVSV